MDRKLLAYLPTILQDIREYLLITKTEQPEIEALWQAIASTMKDQFIVDATENGVQRWEQILHIIPKATSDLDTRKFTVLTRLNEQLPFTVTSLEQQLAALCGADGYTLALNNDLYTLDVQIQMSVKEKFSDVEALVQREAPANLVVNITLKYNQHKKLMVLTNKQLNQYRHRELRNEVVL